jgi:hypothetical protein
MSQRPPAFNNESTGDLNFCAFHMRFITPSPTQLQESKVEETKWQDDHPNSALFHLPPVETYYSVNVLLAVPDKAGQHT